MRALRRPSHAHHHVYKQDFKTSLLAKVAPSLNAAAWQDDIYQVSRPDSRSPHTRIQTRDRGWIEIDDGTGTLRIWGQPGRAGDLARALAEAEGYEHVDHLAVAGDVGAAGERRLSRPQAVDLAAWWRERGYDAVAERDGVWIDAGRNARLQDVGDRLRLHGTLTPEAARAIILKASEAWGGDAELTGMWTQPDRDLLWLEAQRAGVRLGQCDPSDEARAAWESETATARVRDDTLGMVKAATGPAQILRDAAAGDASALTRLDPDLKAFVASYLDDEQRGDLARSDVADIIPELARFRELGASERTKSDRGRDATLVPDQDAPLDMLSPASAPGR